ncbi:MAG: TIR domain-containing protein [Ferruginibacter sp.]|nr:TIR domain-containing protein [Ferruginibacter sp.]
MADIFISYSNEDKVIIKKIAGLLENKGWTVWWDKQIPIGENFDAVIENELHKAGCVLVVWTQKSITSAWVKNEATEAAQKGTMLPVMLEQDAVPPGFKRVESTTMIGWKGEQGHPGLDRLFSSIENMLGHKIETATPVDDKGSDTNDKSIPAHRIPVSGYGIIAAIGFIVSLFLVYYYLQFIQGKVSDEVDQRMFYLILILFGTSISALVFGVMNTYAVLKGKQQNVSLKMAGPGVGVILVVLGGFYLPPKTAEKNATIRVFDWKQNPVTQGNVKIYLKEYIRSQAIDNMGQALFTGLPSEMASSKMKIEVSSPGYATKTFDTLLTNSKPLELTLPLTTVIFISGKVKTAAEMPIRGVEINVDGTRYYAISITDGSYTLRLEEYTLGDQITLTTSHKDFEDKTIPVTINSPDIKNQDIFLNPITH